MGEGVAAHLRALGVTVSVSEIDPVRALLATHDGYDVVRVEDGAVGALVVSATGWPGTVTPHLSRLAKAVAVAGGTPGEIAWNGALVPVVPQVDRDEDGTLILDRGGCINVTAAEGNPIEIMDLSFATQAGRGGRGCDHPSRHRPHRRVLRGHCPRRRHGGTHPRRRP
ncbi:hypothetical protein [Demequina litorisediminis]|uniref:hypothetical protein n=1 Tax=Demequina litorisediminis TaxID=1849022 RepID=UPI003D678B30